METPEKPVMAGETPLGLTQAEVDARVAQGRINLLPPSREGSVRSIFRRNILTLFNLLNLVLALLLLFAKSYRNMLFLGVVFSNTFIGIVQELRAKRMHDRLQLLSEGLVRVFRDGQEVHLPSGALVQDDVVRLSRGEYIPADAEVLQGSCEANEALLTGESKPVAKKAGDGLFSGSFLTEGAVRARLTAVGADSYAGQLQVMARKVKPARSELMENMQKIIRRVSALIVPLGLLLFWRHMTAHELGVDDSLVKTVGAVLGMIPEGLILLTSVALTVGVIRLGRRNALVNALYGIEALARTDIVCMDKTGTLTSGDMTLEQTIPLHGMPPEIVTEAMAALLSLQEDENATQVALKNALFPSGVPKCEAPSHVVPFSSERKWSGATFPSLGALVMGAPERLLTDFPDALDMAKEQAESGMRVLALLTSEQPMDSQGSLTIPDTLRPLALFCLRDALRPEVCETVRYFGAQGVALKVLSGDNPRTVVHIAQAAGVPHAEKYIDLSACVSPVDYSAICEEYTIFGRVSPEDKRELIAALRAQGHHIAMVGDGVNDIPALKAADCSIALAGGSSAACRIAQITLLDGSFAAVPEIVREGRNVINNITRTSSLFLVKNIFSFLLTASMLLLPFVYPFAPIQLTLVASLTIGIPAFALALQPSNERIEGSFLRKVMAGAFPGGITVWLVTLLLCTAGNIIKISPQAVGTLCTLAAGWNGLWVLLLICRPWNALRGLLVLGMAALLFAAVTLFAPLFYLVPLAGNTLWLLAGTLLIVPLCLWGARAVLKALRF